MEIFPGSINPPFLERKSYYKNENGRFLIIDDEKTGYQNVLQLYKLNIQPNDLRAVYVQCESEKKYLEDEFGHFLFSLVQIL